MAYPFRIIGELAKNILKKVFFMISKNNEISPGYHDLPGYVHGAKIIKVALTKTPIDNISDVV